MKSPIAKETMKLAVTALLLALCTDCRFFKQGARHKQVEAKTNLSNIYTMQKIYKGANNTYAKTFWRLNFIPAGEGNYSYFMGEDVISASIGGPYQVPEGIESEITRDSYRVVAVANLDVDPTLDVWVIDNENRMRNLVDDVDE